MEFDIFNDEPREIRCVRNNEDGMIASSENHHFLEIGKTYHVTNIEVDSWYTLVYLKEFPDKTFNSVAFNEIV